MVGIRGLEGVPFDGGEDDWSPASIPGLQMWFDAGYGIGRDGASNRVSSWLPRIGTVTAVQTTTASMPTFQVSGGLPSVVFDGTDDQLVLQNPFVVGDASTCFAVVRISDLSISRPIFSGAGSGAYSFSVLNSGAVRLQITLSTTICIGSAGAVQPSNSHLVMASFDRSSGAWGTAVNQSTKQSGISAAVPAFSQVSNRIGSQSGGLLAGELMDLLMFRQVLTASQIDLLSAKLMNKWRIF